MLYTRRRYYQIYELCISRFHVAYQHFVYSLYICRKHIKCIAPHWASNYFIKNTNSKLQMLIKAMFIRSVVRIETDL